CHRRFRQHAPTTDTAPLSLHDALPIYPIEWNALKFIGPSGMFLDAEQGAQMRELLQGEIPRARWAELGEVREDPTAAERHLAKILALPFLDLDRIRARRFHVALDCVRGAGGTIFRRLLEELGCELTATNLETDGRCPREPEPVAANLGQLEELVRRSGADGGFATEPDVGRLSLVDEQGRAIGEDYTLA